MSTMDLDQRASLILQLERDLVAQTRLRMLLTDANTTVARRRDQLRTVKARIKRAQTKR